MSSGAKGDLTAGVDPLLRRAADATLEYLKTFEERFDRIQLALDNASLTADDSLRHVDGLHVEELYQNLKQTEMKLEPIRKHLEKRETVDELAGHLLDMTLDLADIAMDIDTLECWLPSPLNTFADLRTNLEDLKNLVDGLKDRYPKIEDSFTLAQLQSLLAALENLRDQSDALLTKHQQQQSQRQLAVYNQPKASSRRRHFAMPNSDDENENETPMMSRTVNLVESLRTVEQGIKGCIREYSSLSTEVGGGRFIPPRFSEAASTDSRLAVEQWNGMKALYQKGVDRNDRDLKRVIDSLADEGLKLEETK